MKQIKSAKKLVLDTHTVRTLEASRLVQIAGGNLPPLPPSNKYRCGSATC